MISIALYGRMFGTVESDHISGNGLRSGVWLYMPLRLWQIHMPHNCYIQMGPEYWTKRFVSISEMYTSLIWMIVLCFRTFMARMIKIENLHSDSEALSTMTKVTIFSNDLVYRERYERFISKVYPRSCHCWFN